MDEDEINYRNLRKIQQMEKNSPSLTEIKPDFFNKLSEYLEYLNKRFESETSSQKRMLLNDEIQNTKKIAYNIYEQREKKILLAVISKARGGDPDIKNMTDIEKNLFEPILEIIQNSRRKILEKETTQAVPNNINTNKLEEKKKDDNIKNSNPILRVVQDIPEFVGTDEKKYNLKNNDIISLPEDMSDMLLKRGVVKKI
ncbi:MAG TPA: hypothetical protein VGB37_17790 [Candidatus Lokiarchaeia archaeon]